MNMNDNISEESLPHISSSSGARSTLKSAGTMAFWLVIWPLFMLLVLIIISGLVLQPIISILAETTSPSAGRLYFYCLVLFFMVLCGMLIFILKRAKRRFITQGAVVLRAYMWLGVIVGGLIAVAIPDIKTNSADLGIQANTTTNILMPELTHDPHIVDVLHQIGATDIDLIDERYAPSYNDPDYSEKWGEYQAFVNQATQQFAYGKLTVLQGLDPEQEKISVAHEYLHHVWFKLLDVQAKDNLTAQLIGMYGNDPVIRDRVKEYVAAGNLYPTELFSYYCTESSNGYLTQYVLDTCNKYINRSVLRLAR